MTNDINVDEEFGLTHVPPRRQKKERKRTEFLGELHELITRGLPDLVDENGTLDVQKLRKHFDNISAQAIYKWFQRKQISPKRVAIIVALSKSQKTGKPDPKTKKPWTPLSRDDFWEYMDR